MNFLMSLLRFVLLLVSQILIPGLANIFINDYKPGVFFIALSLFLLIIGFSFLNDLSYIMFLIYYFVWIIALIQILLSKKFWEFVQDKV